MATEKKAAWKHKHSENHRCLLLADFSMTPRPTKDLSDIDPFSLVSKRWTIPLKFAGVDGCYERLFTTALTKLLACFFCQRKRSYGFTIERNKIANKHWAILLRWNKYSGCSCILAVENPVVSVWKAGSALFRFEENKMKQYFCQ